MGSRLPDTPANDPVEREIFTCRGGEIDIVGNPGGLMPAQPQLPAIGQIVRHFHLDAPGDCPMVTPPRGRMEGTEVRWPLRWELLDLLLNTSVDDTDSAVRLEQPGQGAEEVYVRPKVFKGIDGEDRIEIRIGKGERTGIGMKGEHAVLQVGCTNALSVFRRRNPQVGRPHLHPKLAGQEDRTKRLPAAEVKHPRAGSQVHCLAQELRQPQHVRPHFMLDDPGRIVG